MKKLLIALLLIALNFATAKAQTKTTLCVTTYCKDSLFLPTNSIPLVAYITSTDPIASRVWSLSTGNAGATLTATSNPDSVIAGNLTVGTYIFKYSISTTKGTSTTAFDTVLVVPAPNQSPIAIVPKDTSISLPQNVFILDGSKSFDPDGTISTYSWSGPSIVSRSGAYASVGGLTVGVYTYTLTVTDNQGATSTIATFHLTVLAAKPPRRAVLITYDDGTSQNSMP